MGNTLEAIVEQMRRAALELTPLAIDIGGARYFSYADSVRQDPNAQLLLSPFPDAPLPESDTNCAILVRPVVEAGWTVVARRISVLGGGVAALELEGAVFAEPDANEAAERWCTSDHLLLVVPEGTGDGGSYVFPVTRIGTDSCEVRTAGTALAPHMELAYVEVVGDRRLLRRATAQVLETRPWYGPHGARGFLTRLALCQTDERARRHARDLVTEPREVKKLIDLAAMTRAEGPFQAPGWGRGRARLLEASVDRARFEIWPLPAKSSPPEGAIRIGFALFDIEHEIDVRVIEREGSSLTTTLPLVLRRRRRHRREHRVSVSPPHRVELYFRDPVSGGVRICEVTGLSFANLAFTFAAHEVVLWEGLPLEHAQLAWNGLIVHLGDLVVEELGYDEATERPYCSGVITSSMVAEDPDMIRLLATLAHPHVRAHRGEDFETLHALYLKAGLFGPHMERNLGPIVEQTRSVWRRLHGQAADVARTFVHGPEHATDSAVTVIRAWEHTWIPQHFVDMNPEINGSTGRLQTAYLDHVVPRPDGRYLVFFIKADNRVMNAYLTRFFSATGTPDAVTRSTVELWSGLAAERPAPEPSAEIEVVPLEAAHEVTVARAVQRCFGPYSAAALSMVPGEFSLPDTASRFARAGLDRLRECQMVLRNGVPVYALLEERSTPGINLTWMLNATWLIPVHASLDRDGAALDAALHAILSNPPQSPTGEHFLNLPPGLDAERLGAWGFSPIAPVNMYVLTRAGVHRFLQYAVDRYGEIDALALRRERRRASHRPKLT